MKAGTSEQLPDVQRAGEVATSLCSALARRLWQHLIMTWETEHFLLMPFSKNLTLFWIFVLYICPEV